VTAVDGATVIAVTMLLVATLMLGHAALTSRGLVLRAQQRLAQADRVGDRHGHDGARRELVILRHQQVRTRIAFGLSAVITLVALMLALLV